MPPEKAPDGVGGDPALIAAAVRNSIDAILAKRAPADRNAFWNAVAIHYARSPRKQDLHEPCAEPQLER